MYILNIYISQYKKFSYKYSLHVLILKIVFRKILNIIHTMLNNVVLFIILCNIILH
jgi:hypothetical protein